MDARVTVGTRTFAAGFIGFLTIVPLKVVLVKSLLLLLMGPLAATGALAGWLIRRATWRGRAGGRESQLGAAFP